LFAVIFFWTRVVPKLTGKHETNCNLWSVYHSSQASVDLITLWACLPTPAYCRATRYETPRVISLQLAILHAPLTIIFIYWIWRRCTTNHTTYHCTWSGNYVSLYFLKY